MRKKSFGQKYIYITTKKPLFFYAFLLLGIALFNWLTLTTRIDTADGSSQTLFYMIFVRAGKGL